MQVHNGKRNLYEKNLQQIWKIPNGDNEQVSQMLPWTIIGKMWLWELKIIPNVFLKVNKKTSFGRTYLKHITDFVAFISNTLFRQNSWRA